MNKSTAIRSFVVAVTLIFAAAAPAQATVTNIKDGAVGPAPVFDVQYNFSGGNLNISGVDYPYGGSGQLNSSNWSDGDYVKFVDSTSNPGTLALERFNSSDVSQGLLDATGTFRAIGDDFIFYLGGGFYGTVITTGAGFAYGDAATLDVTEEDPSNATALAYSNCIETPIAVGGSRENPGGSGGGGGGGADNPTLDLNLHVKVGEILAGKDVEYTGEGLMADSEYVLELHSQVIELGSGIADADGNFIDTVTLPDNIEPGEHRIILRGTDPDGNTLERVAYIYVGTQGELLAKSFSGPFSRADVLAFTGPVGYDPAMLGALGVVALIAGVVLVARRRVRS
jgi:hypothetical protein